MLTREGLWQRLAGSHRPGAVSFRSGWLLCWGLVLSSALPWLIPEDWNGQIAPIGLKAGLGLCGLALVSLFFKRTLWMGVLVLIPLLTVLGLRHLVIKDKMLPDGLVGLEGRISAPWMVNGERRQSRIRLWKPVVCRGQEVRLSLPLEGAPEPPPGAWVKFRSEWRAVESVPKFLGERPLWRARDEGIPRRIYLRSAQLLERSGDVRPSLLLRVRCYALDRFKALPLTGTARDLWGALTLGIPPVKDEVFTAFAESGTIHTLVVSGLQITLVMISLESLWRRVARRGSTAVSILGGLLYSGVVGFSAPVWRGLLMGIAWALGRKSGWKVPPVYSLHGALLLWLLLHPASGADPGFLLAWFALLSLIWLAEPLANLWSPLLGRSSLWVARFLAPWLVTMPLLALFHGGAPVFGALANILVLPLVSFLTPVCLALTLFPVTFLVNWAGHLLQWTGEWMVPRFAAIQPLATGILFPWLLLLVLWPLLAHWHASFRKTRAITVFCVSLTLTLFFSRGTGRPVKTLELEAPDVGQGDALLLRQPAGDALLVDTGPSPWAGRRLIKILSRRGVRENLHLAITHPHGDHAMGWHTLVRLWRVESITLPEVARPQERWAPFVSQSQLQGVRFMRRGGSWRWGEVQWDVHWPPKPFELPDANMLSLVLRASWRDREIWFMGDALNIQEKDLMDLGDPPPCSHPMRRLLKAGHHGSNNTSDPEWIRRLKPEKVIFTAGRNNSFDFPGPETLVRFRAAGICDPLITGPLKGIRIAAVDEGWRVEKGIVD